MALDSMEITSSIRCICIGEIMTNPALNIHSMAKLFHWRFLLFVSWYCSPLIASSRSRFHAPRLIFCKDLFVLWIILIGSEGEEIGNIENKFYNFTSLDKSCQQTPNSKRVLFSLYFVQFRAKIKVTVTNLHSSWRFC